MPSSLPFNNDGQREGGKKDGGVASRPLAQPAEIVPVAHVKGDANQQTE